MPAPRFVSNDLFGAPGVYVRELRPTAPVRGQLRNTVGIVGQCVRGPVNVPIECTSYGRFLAVFGGRDYGAGGAVIGKVWEALQNKPIGKFVVVRAAAAAAAVASFDWETAAGGAGTAVLRIAATSPGLWGNDVSFKVTAATDGDANKFNLTIRYLGTFTTYENLNIFGSNDNLALVVGTDEANLVVLTKLAAGRPVNTAAGVDGADTEGYVNLGETVSGFTSVAGTEGSIADTDYTGAGKAMEILANQKAIGIRYVAGRSNAAVKAKLLALAQAANEGLWLFCPDSSSVTVSTWNTELATMRDDRAVGVYNHPKTRDPDTGEVVTVEPHAWLAGVLSQTEPDVHPGVVDNAPYLAGIVGLTHESLALGDYDALDAAGSTVLERTTDEAGNTIFAFANGVTTDLAANNRQLDGRRQKDFLISGIIQRARGDQFRPNTRKRRLARQADISAWLTELAKAERFVRSDAGGKPLFTYTNDESVNPAGDVDSGIQRDLVRIKLIPMNLVLSLQIEAGTNVDVRVIEVDEAA